MNKKIGVVVPAYNEETQIARVIETMPDFVDKIIIINDCSQDKTSEVVRGYINVKKERIILLEHISNQGVGSAIATGYKWCRDQDIDVAVVMAGDAQMNPADLSRLLDPVVDNQVDYTKGNRLVTPDAFQKIPKLRFIGNAILSVLTKIASGYWHVADSQTGYTAINRRALQAIDWDKMFKRYGQPNDLLVRLNVVEMRVLDVPVSPVYNIGEKSGIKIYKVIFSISWLILRLFFWRLKEKYVLRSFHPLVFFYIFGLFTFGLSFVMMSRLMILWHQFHYVPEITFLSWLFSFAVGFNAVSFAMWFDYQENKHLNPPMSWGFIPHSKL